MKIQSLILVLITFTLSVKAQNNPSAKHALRFSYNADHYSGFGFEAGYENFLKPRHSVLIGYEASYRYKIQNFDIDKISLNIGYKFNFITIGKLELYLGIDFKTGLLQKNNYYRFNGIYSEPFSSLHANLEVNYNFNKNISIYSRASSTFRICRECKLLDGLAIGLKHKF